MNKMITFGSLCPEESKAVSEATGVAALCISGQSNYRLESITFLIRYSRSIKTPEMVEKCISPCCPPLSATSSYLICLVLFLSNKIQGFSSTRPELKTLTNFFCPCQAQWLIQPQLLVNKNVHQTYADCRPWDRTSSRAHLETPSHHRADWYSPCDCSHSWLISVMYFMGQGRIRVQLIHWWPLTFSLHSYILKALTYLWENFFNRFWCTVYLYYYIHNHTLIQRLSAYCYPWRKKGTFPVFLN